MRSIAYHEKELQISERIRKLYVRDPIVHTTFTAWLQNEQDVRSYTDVLETIIALLIGQCDAQREQWIKHTENQPGIPIHFV